MPWVNGLRDWRLPNEGLDVNGRVMVGSNSWESNGHGISSLGKMMSA